MDKNGKTRLSIRPSATFPIINAEYYAVPSKLIANMETHIIENITNRNNIEIQSKL
jgi:hypothetical protein